ncbi:ATP-binding protein [Streptomyces sp. NPDC004647]|uniref:ATP-binding protein n=1 Tax=Streptomyces sp. NPDC004647 TaxID=3154671 RepID=UPI0033B7BCA0
MALMLETPAWGNPVRATTRSVRGQLDMTLNVEAEHLATVRRIIREHLHLWGVGDQAVGRTLTAVNELLTNVWQHTAPDDKGWRMADLLVQRVRDGVTAIVRDQDVREPEQVVPDLLDESGRGWPLVRALSDDFSVSATEAGKDVWVYIAET